jgi:hypothetical protein
MTSAAIGAEEVMPRRVRVVGRPGSTAHTAPAPARARTRERAQHLRPVRDGETAATVAAPAARPVRGGTSHRVATAPTTATSAPSVTVRAKAAAKARTKSLPKIRISAAPLRRLARVMYRDTVDGWIVQNRTLSMGEVFHLNYAVPGDWKPFRIWCTFYTRTFGTFVAAVLDGAKFLLIHPVRGPITVTFATVGPLVGTHFIH